MSGLQSRLALVIKYTFPCYDIVPMTLQSCNFFEKHGYDPKEIEHVRRTAICSLTRQVVHQCAKAAPCLLYMSMEKERPCKEIVCVKPCLLRAKNVMRCSVLRFLLKQGAAGLSLTLRPTKTVIERCRCVNVPARDVPGRNGRSWGPHESTFKFLYQCWFIRTLGT